MELCVDNPREGFADLFATHPSVQSRVDALVKFAGGHDPGLLPPPADEDETDQSATDEPETQANQQDAPPALPQGPWNDAGGSAAPPPVPAPSPSGTAAGNPLGSPIGNPIGPWGRH
jgi:heat shock protein HtpX